MKTSNLSNRFISLVIIIIILSGCNSSTSTPIAENDIQITSFTKGELVTGQIIQTRTFDQCNSSNPLAAQLRFAEASSESTQKDLELSAGVSGEASIPIGAKIILEGAIEDYFSAERQISQNQQESISIDIPSRTRQEYTIIWRDIRQEGSIDYIIGGREQVAFYSYRVGMEVLSVSGREVACSPQATPTRTGVPTETLIPPRATESAVPLDILAAGCISSKIWTADSTDSHALNTISIESNGCYSTKSLGIFADPSGKLRLFVERTRTPIISGIYTPIKDDSIIEFSVYVNSMNANLKDEAAEIIFAVGPADNHVTTRGMARFKLRVEETGQRPFIRFAIADVGENSGAQLETQHYQYGRTYLIRFELTGDIMSVYINDFKLSESLEIPSGSKLFYIGYDLPSLAGIDIEIRDISIDGLEK